MRVRALLCARSINSSSLIFPLIALTAIADNRPVFSVTEHINHASALPPLPRAPRPPRPRARHRAVIVRKFNRLFLSCVLALVSLSV